VVSLAVVVGLLGVLFGGRRAAGKSLSTHTARFERWVSPIESDGSLEPAETSDIVCKVQARSHGSTVATTIKWVIEDGSTVRKGQVVAELDSSGLEEDLKAQRIARDLARLDWDQAEGDRILTAHQNDADIEAARTTLALARIDLDKYVNGEYPQAREDVNNRLQQWKDRVAYSERMVKKGFMSRGQADGDRFALDRVVLELQVLEYTRDRTVTDLRSRLAEAGRAVERVKEQARARDLLATRSCLVKKRIFLKRDVRVREIEEEVRKCTIVAPRAGQVVYCIAQQNKYGAGAQQSIVAQGEPVREGQLLMQIPDLTHMMVRVPVHEALVNYLHEGEDSLIRLDAYPGRTFHGHVKQIAGVGSFVGYRTADIKVYQTVIVIDETFDGFRPNMTAHVKILPTTRTEPVLTVPVEAIVQSPEDGGRCACYVDTPDGPEERAVVVGMHDERNAEIRSGLSDGDKVILEPGNLDRELHEGS
jgi:multidrug efflux pump subunit AcrA (membrane-fusion protein)